MERTNSQIIECSYLHQNSTAGLSPFFGRMKPNRTTHSGYSSISGETYFPVIIVFAQFQDSPNNWDWPSPTINNGKPIYIDSLIAPFGAMNNQNDWWDAYNENTQRYSDIWSEISRGVFHVLEI